MSVKMSLIVAVAENGVIGSSGGMAWCIRSETKYFKQTTMGKPVIHGRKSFEALGAPLPGRLNIVVTRDKSYMPGGVVVAHDVPAAIKIAREAAEADGVDEFFICGGAEIYKLTLPQADMVYYTTVHMKPEGETLFPNFDRADRTQWREVKREFHAAQEGEDADYTIFVYEREQAA